MATKNKVSKKQAVASLWKQGVLYWKLDSTQKELYQNYKDNTTGTVVWACSRQLGKSYALVAIAIEMCLQNPNIVVKYVAPKQKQVRTIVKPKFREILADCPKMLQPNFVAQDNVYQFPNGSEIQLAGTDNDNAENLRGGTASLCIVDEAGSCKDLEYIVQSILLPTMTTTQGKIILASTPPKTQAHDFIDYMKAAEYEGNLVKKTIYDNPRLSQQQIEKIIQQQGGKDSVSFRREYLVEVIIDSSKAVVPEFTPEIEEEIVREWPKPPYADRYVSMDIGFRDLTVALFAYYDFREETIVIEDELVLNGPDMTTDNLADSIMEKEQELWHDEKGEPIDPHIRVCDNNLIVINDLQNLHGITFLPTNKDDADMAINQLRMMISSKKIAIHPRCETLIFHLKNAVWDHTGKKYDRSPDAGHFDAIDAIKYLVRNVQYARNPYPPDYDMPVGDKFYNPFMDHDNQGTEIDRFFKGLFSTKSWFNK